MIDRLRSPSRPSGIVESRAHRPLAWSSRQRGATGFAVLLTAQMPQPVQWQDRDETRASPLWVYPAYAISAKVQHALRLPESVAVRTGSWSSFVTKISMGFPWAKFALTVTLPVYGKLNGIALNEFAGRFSTSSFN